MDLTQIVVHSVKDGDVLFVDAEGIDGAKLAAAINIHFEERKFLIVPVFVERGKTVSDYLAVGRKEVTQEIL